MMKVLFQRLSAWMPVTLCTMLLPLCALIIQPWAAIGIIDDWSYIRTAQTLAKTGHIAYIGWSSAMLGWQLYVGALMIKLFGASFNAPRVGTLLIAMGVGALMQRLYVRLGLSEWNSAAVTVIFLCSPPWIATTFTFMSDVYGMFVLLGCCYCCVRALQANTENEATLWISVAAIATGIGGTARQIAWLGVLVMVPCALWLLRRNRRALWIGSMCTALGIAAVPLSIAWFNRQPFALPESALPTEPLSLKPLLLQQIPGFVEKVGFELLFLTAPLLLSFLGVVRRNRRALLGAGLVVLYWAVRMPFLHHRHNLESWFVPYFYNSVWFHGWQEHSSYIGNPAILLTMRVRLVLTVLVLAGELGLAGLLAFQRTDSDKSSSLERRASSLPVKQLLVLLGPCTLAYTLLLLPRYLAGVMVDRYVLFLEFILLGAVVLLYQRKVAARLPSVVWVLASLYVVVNTMGLHDTFNLFRARVALLDRLQAAGYPRVQLDGGIEFNGWTEATVTGYVNDPLIQNPVGVYRAKPTIHATTDRCHTQYLEFMPSVHAKYVVSFDPNACGGRTSYEQSYSAWLGTRMQTIYAVKGPE